MYAFNVYYSNRIRTLLLNIYWYTYICFVKPCTGNMAYFIILKYKSIKRKGKSREYLHSYWRKGNQDSKPKKSGHSQCEYPQISIMNASSPPVALSSFNASKNVE